METKSSILEGLPSNSQYRVKVTPYDLNGSGMTSDAVVFRTAADGAIEKPGSDGSWLHVGHTYT